jgi:hypothetical protein
MIEQAALFESILYGRKVSGASSILGVGRIPDAWSGSTTFMPPILIAGYQESPGTIPGVPAATPGPHSAVAAFEDMSLAIRKAAFGLSEEAPESQPSHSGSDALPYWAKSIHSEIGHCEGRDVAAAVRNACRATRPEDADSVGPDLAPSLKLVGLKICGDLDLSKLDIPFSIRLVCCWIEGALLLDRTKLVTLDLSGSVIEKGASCNYMEASGAVRMRRTVSAGPLDFGGATIGATLDASDAIIIPKNRPPRSVSFVGDRNILNLSLATVEKEARFNRSRIYGGVNLRGISIRGSLFLDDAIIRSPIGCVEKMACEEASRLGLNLPYHMQASSHAENDLAELLWPISHGGAVQYKRSIERLLGVDAWEAADIPLGGSFTQNGTTLLDKLLSESARAAGCAIRAEGAKITGNLVARSVRICGRARLKYVEVQGSISLNGARFRTVRCLEQGLNIMGHYSVTHGQGQRLAMIKKAYDAAIERLGKLEPSDRDEYVLDLQESRVSGSIDLGRDERKLVRKTGERGIIGVIARQLCATGEDPVKFFPVFYPRPGDPHAHVAKRFGMPSKDELLQFHTRLEQVGKHVDPEHYEYVRKLDVLGVDPADLDMPMGRISGTYREIDVIRVSAVCGKFGRISSSLVSGELIFSGARIGGSLRFNGLIANVFGEPAKKPTIVLRGATLGGDLDFRDSVGVTAIEAQQVEVAGSVRFANSPEYDVNRDTWKPLRRRSLLMFSREGTEKVQVGSFQFEGARIKGDATFIFDRSRGPSLDLALSKIGGKLTILPAIGGLELSAREMAADARESAEKRSLGQVQGRIVAKVALDAAWMQVKKALTNTRDFDDLKRSQARIDEGFKQARAANRDRPPETDLRNASATVFAHPPSAWPCQDGLVVEGFRYDRIKEYGPLASNRKTWVGVTRDSRRNSTGYVEVAARVVLVAAIFSLAWNLWPAVINLLGHANFILLGTLCTAVTAVLSLRAYTVPRRPASHPLAIEWLKLQRRRFNARKVGAAIQPMEPYIHAAMVLRASGRVNSANSVELERLRNRRRALSWRTSAPVRVVLKLTDLLVVYGFAPMRAVAIALGFVILGGVAGNIVADGNGLLESDQALVQLLEGKHLDAVAKADREGGKPHARPVYPEFFSTLYSMDVMIPYLDLGQEKYWLVVTPEVDEHPMPDWMPASLSSRLGNSLQGLLKSMARTAPHFFVFLRILGWLFTSIIVIAVVSRIETILARNEEV